MQKREPVSKTDQVKVFRLEKGYLTPLLSPFLLLSTTWHLRHPHVTPRFPGRHSGAKGTMERKLKYRLENFCPSPQYDNLRKVILLFGSQFLYMKIRKAWVPSHLKCYHFQISSTPLTENMLIYLNPMVPFRMQTHG